MLQLFLQLLDTETEKQNFTLLYETYRRLMHWVAKDILKDEALAEDAVHEAFLRIIKNFHKINEIICPETRSYVVIIVRNVALNMREREKREVDRRPVTYEPASGEKDLYNDELHDILTNISYGFDETVDELCRREIISEILSLPDILKEVLLLYGYFGYSIRDIGSALNISEDATYKRLQRARKMLSEKIERVHNK